MTGKEALKELRQYNSVGLCGDKTLFEPIEKDLETLEELKDPHDEYETEDYLCTREAYYNNNLGELCFAYTIFKWDGTYREHKAPILKKPLKMKNWKEESHAGCGNEKIDLKEYLENHIKARKRIESREENEI